MTIDASETTRETIIRLDFHTLTHAALFGGGRGIGLALVQQILQRASALERLWVSYRDDQRAKSLLELAENDPRLVAVSLDPLSPEQMQSLTENMKQHCSHLDLVINAIGILDTDQTQAEKSIKSCHSQQLLRYFEVNSCISPMIMQHLFPLFRGKDLSLFAALSAKVGSIGDNHLGGWYGYRASKAALNMLVRTVAMEFRHRRMNAAALVVHPGTTRTDLSAAYIKNSPLTIHSPEQSANNILDVLAGKSIQESGRFWNWDGQELPW